MIVLGLYFLSQKLNYMKSWIKKLFSSQEESFEQPEITFEDIQPTPEETLEHTQEYLKSLEAEKNLYLRDMNHFQQQKMEALRDGDESAYEAAKENLKEVQAEHTRLGLEQTYLSI